VEVMLLVIKAQDLAALEMKKETSKYSFHQKKAKAPPKEPKPKSAHRMRVFKSLVKASDVIPVNKWPVWFKHHGLTYRWVDGDWIRNHELKGEQGVVFVDGGHHWVYSYIPKDEIWIEQNMRNGPLRDPRLTAAHERVERHDMNKTGADYEEGHGIATAIEGRIRRGEDPKELIHIVKHLIKLAKEIEDKRDARSA
jgi:hypothetical protein